MEAEALRFKMKQELGKKHKAAAEAKTEPSKPTSPRKERGKELAAKQAIEQAESEERAAAAERARLQQESLRFDDAQHGFPFPGQSSDPRTHTASVALRKACRMALNHLKETVRKLQVGAAEHAHTARTELLHSAPAPTVANKAPNAS